MPAALCLVHGYISPAHPYRNKNISLGAVVSAVLLVGVCISYVQAVWERCVISVLRRPAACCSGVLRCSVFTYHILDGNISDVRRIDINIKLPSKYRPLSARSFLVQVYVF